MGDLIYGSSNLIDINTLDSVSNEHAIYKKEYLYNARPSLPLRFTAKTDQSIVIDMIVPKLVTLVALINHNLQSIAPKIKLQFDTDPPNWATASEIDLTWRAENIYKKLSETFRWWRFLISDPTNPNLLQIGEAILTTHSKFTDGAIQEQSEGDSFITASEETFMGQDWDVELSRKASLLMGIRKISTAGDSVVEEIRALLRTIRGSAGQLLIIPDDSYGEVYYMKAKGTQFLSDRIFHNIKDVRDWGLEFIELCQGIDLL